MCHTCQCGNCKKSPEITEKDIYKVILVLIESKANPTAGSVACTLLSLLEKKGFKPDVALIKAIVDGCESEEEAKHILLNKIGQEA